MEPNISYKIEMTTNTLYSFPRIYRIMSIDGAEVLKQLVSFKEVQAVNPELGVEYAELYKAFLENFVDSIDTSLGFLGLKELDFSNFASGIDYVSSVSALTIYDAEMADRGQV